MTSPTRKASLLIEMIGSAAICGLALVANLAIEARRRRAAATAPATAAN